MTKCILSGLEIPEGKETKEHLVPRSRFFNLINNPGNIFPAHKIMNCIKGDLLPCEFEQLKYHISYQAIERWRIKETDKDFIRSAIINWQEGYNPDWCSICLLNCKHKHR